MLIHCPAGLALLAQTGQANWAFETVPQPGPERPPRLPAARQGAGRLELDQRDDLRARPPRATTTTGPREGNPGWGCDDVLPYFKRAEHNERGADACHGAGGPLNVMDLRSPNRFGPVFVEAGAQAGYPRNADFNGAEQEGVGLYQVTHRNGERCSAAKAYLHAAPGPRQPAGHHRRARDAHRCSKAGAPSASSAAQGGATRSCAARREVLLCAGALQSPQLLMLSGIGPGAHLQRARHRRACTTCPAWASTCTTMSTWCRWSTHRS